MSNYFKNFPTTLWNKQIVVDISRRAAILDKFASNPYAFQTYTIQEEDTLEQIAYHYYGNASYSWLIVLANNIVDPYTDFWKNQRTLQKFIAQKYFDEASEYYGIEEPSEQQVLEFTQNRTISDNIVYWYSQYNEDIQINNLTQETIPSGEFLPMRYYEYEEKKNEELRTIYLINDSYVSQLVDEMRTLLHA